MATDAIIRLKSLEYQDAGPSAAAQADPSITTLVMATFSIVLDFDQPGSGGGGDITFQFYITDDLSSAVNIARRYLHQLSSAVAEQTKVYA